MQLETRRATWKKVHMVMKIKWLLWVQGRKSWQFFQYLDLMVGQHFFSLGRYYLMLNCRTYLLLVFPYVKGSKTFFFGPRPTLITSKFIDRRRRWLRMVSIRRRQRSSWMDRWEKQQEQEEEMCPLEKIYNAKTGNPGHKSFSQRHAESTPEFMCTD